MVENNLKLDVDRWKLVVEGFLSFFLRWSVSHLHGAGLEFNVLRLQTSFN